MIIKELAQIIFRKCMSSSHWPKHTTVWGPFTQNCFHCF